MNFMYAISSNSEFLSKDKKILARVEKAREKFLKSKIKIESNFIKLGETNYYYNGLPNVPKERDVLKKPDGVCCIRVNWKKKSFEGKSTDEIYKELKPQYGWNIVTVDAEHSRNKFKNKSVSWAVFDTEEKAQQALTLFNSLFMTAMELDCIEEYKRFKENPEKRPLTFDMLCSNAYELYEQVDNDEL